MTISYSSELCNVRTFGFARLLFRWKGSLYRLIYWECIIFLALYYSIAVVYRFVLNTKQQRQFENIAKYCNEFTDLVPVTFVLGFYIGSFVLARWWTVFNEIPWPDKAILKLTWYVKGKAERSRMIKRTLARYLNLMLVLILQRTSVAVKRRFPTRTHIIDTGLMTQEESATMERLNYKHPNWWMPAIWYELLIREANSEGLITDGDARSMMDDLLEYRQKCHMLWCYDWVSIPLAYTQVVTIAVYSFFIACLFGRQYVFKVRNGDATDSTIINQYFPFFTFIQFIFYMGWLKVGEELANPLGEDDEDFEVNWLIDRHLQTSFLIIDGITTHPDLIKDIWWDDDVPPELPYTEAAAQLKVESFMGSANNTQVSAGQAAWQMTSIPEEPSDTVDDLERATSQEGMLPKNTENTPKTMGLIRSVSRQSQMAEKSSTGRKPSNLSNVFNENKKTSVASGVMPSVNTQESRTAVPQQQDGLQTALLQQITEESNNVNQAGPNNFQSMGGTRFQYTGAKK